MSEEEFTDYANADYEHNETHYTVFRTPERGGAWCVTWAWEDHDTDGDGVLGAFTSLDHCKRAIRNAHGLKRLPAGEVVHEGIMYRWIIREEDE